MREIRELKDSREMHLVKFSSLFFWLLLVRNLATFTTTHDVLFTTTLTKGGARDLPGLVHNFPSEQEKRGIHSSRVTLQ